MGKRTKSAGDQIIFFPHCNWVKSDLINEACHLNISELCHVSLNCGPFFFFFWPVFILLQKYNWIFYGSRKPRKFPKLTSHHICLLFFLQPVLYQLFIVWLSKCIIHISIVPLNGCICSLFPPFSLSSIWKQGQTADVERERRRTQACKASTRVMSYCYHYCRSGFFTYATLLFFRPLKKWVM